MTEPLQCKRGDAVAPRSRGVVAGFGAQYQPLVVVAHEKESAVFAIFELGEQHLGELARPAKVCRTQVALREFDQGVEQKRVIVEVSVEMRLAVPASCEQALTRSRAFVIRAPQRGADELG